jgi:hypothetical protein
MVTNKNMTRWVCFAPQKTTCLFMQLTPSSSTSSKSLGHFAECPLSAQIMAHHQNNYLSIPKLIEK